MGFLVCWQPSRSQHYGLKRGLLFSAVFACITAGSTVMGEQNSDFGMKRFVLFSEPSFSRLASCLAQASASRPTVGKCPRFCNLRPLSSIPGSIPPV